MSSAAHHAALPALPADVANANVVQDARLRLLAAHATGVQAEIDRLARAEAGWITEVRRQKAAEAARREASRE